jgi:hypothetical protein
MAYRTFLKNMVAYIALVAFAGLMMFATVVSAASNASATPLNQKVNPHDVYYSAFAHFI